MSFPGKHLAIPFNGYATHCFELSRLLNVRFDYPCNFIRTVEGDQFAGLTLLQHIWYRTVGRRDKRLVQMQVLR